MTGIKTLDETVSKAIETLRRDEWFRAHVDKRWRGIAESGAGWSMGLTLIDLANLAFVFMVSYHADIREEHKQKVINIADESRRQLQEVFREIAESLGLDFPGMPQPGDGKLPSALCAGCNGEVSLTDEKCPHCQASFELLH